MHLKFGFHALHIGLALMSLEGSEGNLDGSLRILLRTSRHFPCAYKMFTDLLFCNPALKSFLASIFSYVRNNDFLFSNLLQEKKRILELPLFTSFIVRL